MWGTPNFHYGRGCLLYNEWYNIVQPSHGRVAASGSPWAPHMRSLISHPNNEFEGIHICSRNTTKLLCLSPKTKCTREITSLTGSSSHDELDRDRGRFGAKRATPAVRWLHRTIIMLARLTVSMKNTSMFESFCLSQGYLTNLSGIHIEKKTKQLY